MTQRHNHADILIAIAEGKTVQYNSFYTKNHWEDYNPNDRKPFNPLFCDDQYEWRVKPETKKIKIVNYINTNNNKIVTSFHAENYDVQKEQFVYLQFLNEVVVEVPLDTYDFYFG